MGAAASEEPKATPYTPYATLSCLLTPLSPYAKPTESAWISLEASVARSSHVSQQ